MKTEIIEWIRDIIIAIAIALVILIFFKPIIIQQESMEPNFYSGDYVIISRQAYTLFGDPERGDVVIFKSELEDDNGKNKNLIKRIIGLPGEVVEIKDGYIFIDGEMLDEPYVKEQGISDLVIGGDMPAVEIPDGELFCCGDNRGVSLDSRSIGTIPIEQIIGKVKLRLYPFNSIKTFK